MAFKIKPFYEIDNTSIIRVPMERNVMGRADRNGNILINSKLKNQDDIDKTILHEKVHIEQIKSGDLDYDEENIYWKGKTYKRSELNEGSPLLAWESPAYKKEKTHGKKSNKRS